MNMRREALERKTIKVKEKKKMKSLKTTREVCGANGGSSGRDRGQPPLKQMFPLLNPLTYLRNFSPSSLD